MGLGWWHLADTQHPNFIEQPRPSSQSATIQSPEPISRTTSQYKEFAAGALHYVATLQGPHPLEPETQHAPVTEAIYLAAASGHPIPTETQPAMSHLTAGTTVTGTTPAITGAANGGGLFSSLPEAFSGDRSKSKEFMHSFIRWWKLNKEKAVFNQPYKCVALFLNYMRGPKVEDWADD